MREEACSADTIIRDEDALREPYVREGEQTLTKIIDALKSGTGYTLIEDERVEWATGDAVYIPFGHGTNIAIPARLACAVTSRVKMRR